MTDIEASIRDRISEVLFTEPGERLDQPDFGVELSRFLFEPVTKELLDAMQTTIKQALARWMGDVIEVEDVQMETTVSGFQIVIMYTVSQSHQRRCDAFNYER